jgi:hypothetical protein
MYIIQNTENLKGKKSILDLGAIGQYCSYSIRMSSVILESRLESWFIITHVLMDNKETL